MHMQLQYEVSFFLQHRRVCSDITDPREANFPIFGDTQPGKPSLSPSLPLFIKASLSVTPSLSSELLTQKIR